MIELDHLQVFSLTLTVRGLLHIGNGQKLPKKEYLFNNRKGVVSFLNEQAFFDLLIRLQLVDAFERFCFYGRGDLYSFLFQECHLTQEQVQPAIRYQIQAGDALDANHTLQDIWRFMRNANGDAYVPGSSVKGAFRTALLFQRIKEDTSFHEFERGKLPEENYLHTLHLTNRSENAVNSLMRGIQISDSAVIPDSCMTLASKNDAFISGAANAINLCRECLVAGTAIRFQLTLDQSVLQGAVTVDTILNALRKLDFYYKNTYQSHFKSPIDAAEQPSGTVLRMGGGSGFFTKSLAYPYLGEKNGLVWVSNRLATSFRAHRHDEDPQLGISPRTMKYGRYRNKFYTFGLCEVSIQ